MTDLVVKQVADGKTEEEAKAAIIESVSDGIEGVSSDLLFGDYIKSTASEAKAVELIAETLVDVATDNGSLAADILLNVTSEVAKTIATEMDNEGKFDDGFAPKVDFDVDGNVTVSPNHKPVLGSGYSEPTEEQTQYTLYEDSVTINDIDVSAWFDDKDGDSLSLSFEYLYDGDSSAGSTDLDIDNGMLSGSLKRAGTYRIFVFADDGKTRSDAVEFTISVEAHNEAPKVVESVAAQIQADLNEKEWRVNQSVSEMTISVSDLFEDNDELTFVVKNQTNLTFSVVGGDITITGTPNADDLGTQTFTVVASDAVNEAVEHTFSIEILEALVTNQAPEVVAAVQQQLQTEIETWELTQGTEIEQTINIGGLITDADNDALTYTVTTSFASGVSGAVKDDVLSFSGKIPNAAAANVESVTIEASDGKESVSLTFKLPTIVEGSTPVITLENFLNDGALVEYHASMNMALYNDDGGLQVAPADYAYVIRDGKLCSEEEGTCDTFPYIGQGNRLAIANASSGARDLLLWSHDDISHDAAGIAVPALSGVWHSLADDAGSNERTPDMLTLAYNFDNSTVTAEIEGQNVTGAFQYEIAGSNVEVTLDFGEFGSVVETCTALSAEADLIAMSCDWIHDDSGTPMTNYRLFTNDQNLLNTLIAATIK